MRDYPNRLVWGYHGTSTERVDDILASGFTPSDGDAHWLGPRLVYFFEDQDLALGWAHHWAVPQYGGEPCVVRAILDMDRCLDLTLIRYRRALAEFGAEILSRMDPVRVAEMKQNHGLRELDSLVLGQVLDAPAGPLERFRSVRAICPARFGAAPKRIFPESGPLYQHTGKVSWFDYHDHIQIGVKDLSAISAVERVAHT